MHYIERIQGAAHLPPPEELAKSPSCVVAALSVHDAAIAELLEVVSFNEQGSVTLRLKQLAVSLRAQAKQLENLSVKMAARDAKQSLDDAGGDGPKT